MTGVVPLATVLAGGVLVGIEVVGGGFGGQAWPVLDAGGTNVGWAGGKGGGCAGGKNGG